MPNENMKYSQVEKIPKIKKHLSDIKCCDGDSATFECEIHTEGDTSNIDFRWYKNGRLIPLGNDFEATENGSTAKLIIRHVYPEDEGRYSCIANNNLGNATTSACLIVDVPEEKENLLSRQLNRPSGLNRSRGSTPLSIPRTRSRTTSPVEDSLVHRTGHRFRRRTAPKFYAVPHNKIAELGQTVRFQCAVSGYPEPTTIWDKNDFRITPTSRITLQERDDLRILEICNVTAEDEGLYRIIVENEIGRCEATARLDIMNHRSRQTNGTRTHTSDGSLGRHAVGKVANVGGKCTISCNVPDASSAASISWYKNGDSLKTTQNITPICDKTSAQLQFNNLTTDDSGVYTCITENNSGLTRCSAELIVLDDYNNNSMDLQPPVFVTGLPLRSDAVEGNPFEFKVKLQGELPMEIIWYKNGEKLPNCSDFQYIDNENGEFGLRLNDVFLADSGSYKCEVYNCYGDATSAGQLSVQEEQPFIDRSPFNSKSVLSCNGNFTPAIVTEGPIDMIALRGDTVSLKVTYAGDPEPSIRWMKAGRQVMPDKRISIETENHSSVLKIERVTADDGGKYEICVENVQGSDTHTTSLAVEGSPDAPKGQPNAVAGDRCATVTWQSPPYDGGSIITGYTIEMRSYLNSQWRKVMENCHSLFCTIRGLIPGESYIFRIRAENKHGLSNPSMESIPTYITHADICSPIESARVYIQNGESFNDHYEVLEELGKGRYGIVHKVRDKEFGNYYAAKFIRCIKSNDKEKVREEITLMNQLKHPKLLQLMAAYENVKEIIMVTEYISGGELFERVVADDFTLTERDCILFMRQICEGVAYIHKNNVVHLDLKPENIMCVSRISHQIKLIDFGLAQKISPHTPVRVLFGTPEFIPPEIINYEPIGTETDMWSVGVICYVLLSGLSPFMGENDAETFANITRADFDFDDEAFNAISDDAKDFISSLLIKRKEKRLTAKQCLHHKWLAQHDKTMSCVKLCTDKLKKFIIRRKWQKTGNAIRALGRMATLSAASRRNSNASSSSSNSPRVSLSGAYSSRMSSLGEDTAFVSDNETGSKLETISRIDTNELKSCKIDDNSNIASESMINNEPIENTTSVFDITNENKPDEPFKLANPPKSLNKSVLFKEMYCLEPSNDQATQMHSNNNGSLCNNKSKNGINGLQVDTTSSLNNTNKFKTSHQNSSTVESLFKNKNSNSNLSSLKLDDVIENKNKSSIVSNDDCTVTSKVINGKNNLLNKKIDSNKISKFSDTAKIKTSERLKMFEQLSTPTCTSKNTKKETYVSNKTNFQKAKAFWNRE